MSILRGADHYTVGTIYLNVFFPNGESCCWYCPMLNKHTEECRITNETIYKPRQRMGKNCPMVLEGVDEI